MPPAFYLGTGGLNSGPPGPTEPSPQLPKVPSEAITWVTFAIIDERNTEEATYCVIEGIGTGQGEELDPCTPLPWGVPTLL